MSRFLTSHTSPVKTPKILAVGADGLAWTELDAAGQAKPKQIFWNPGRDAKSAAETWTNTVDQRQWPANADVLVCLQSDIVHHWLQPVPSQTQSLAELHAVATMRAKTLFGDSSKHNWLVSADWDYQHPVLCTAVADEWEDLFQAIQKTHTKLRVVSNLVLALSAHASTLPKQGWLAILIENKLHLLHLQNGHITSLRTVRLPEYDTLNGIEATVIQEWNREKIRTRQDEGELHWLRKPEIRQPEISQPHSTAPALQQALQQAHQLLLNGAQHAS